VGCFMRLGSPGETLDELMPAEEVCRTNLAAKKSARGFPKSSGGAGAQAVVVSLPQAPLKISHQGCCSITDAADARSVAAHLDIPFYVCNFKKDFGRIIDYFVDEYANGRTPNPCVRCNDWLKFGKLHEYAAQIGADCVASGHYARVENVDGEPALLRGLDHAKDQSYVLFGARRSQLPHMMFPIGGMPKARVRELAEEYKLAVFDKPDSQEICFVPDNDYAGLVARKRPGVTVPGNIVDTSGKVLGEHAGQHNFTIGQRRGLDVAVGNRVYVVAKDVTSNTVVVGGKHELLTKSCQVGEANWLVDPQSVTGPVYAKYRYNAKPAIAYVRPSEDQLPGPSGRTGSFDVIFETPQHAVAPGQALVLYSGDRVLGGGWIASVRSAVSVT